MVGTIGPVVHGRSIRYSRWVYLTLFVVAHMIGGALTGFVLALPTAILNRYYHTLNPVGIAVGLIALSMFGSLRDSGFLRFNVPMSKWQVPRRWSLLPVNVMILLYGTILGSGLFTRINSCTYYVFAAACIFRGDLVQSIVLFLLFGFSKSIAVTFITENNMKCIRDGSKLLVSVAGFGRYVPMLSAAVLAAFSVFMVLTFFLSALMM